MMGKNFPFCGWLFFFSDLLILGSFETSVF
jgi:hypothetical protein